MALSCQEATARLQRIQQLKRQFTEELVHAFEKTDMSDLEKQYYDLRGEIILFSQEIEKKSLTITVENAKNPFHEQFKAGGIPDQENPEIKDMTYDLLKILEEDVASYRSHGLEHWAKAFEEYKDKIDDLTSEQKKIIEHEIENGAIPIWIPKKEMLLATTIEQIEKAAKPVVIQNGQKLPVRDGRVEWDYFRQILNTHDHRLVQGVPRQPHVSFNRPTPVPDVRTCNKDVEEQRAKFAEFNAERNQDLPPLHCVTVYEHLALQVRSSERVHVFYGTLTLKNIEPLDSRAYTQFIDLPLESGGNIPKVCFNVKNKQVVFCGGDAGDQRTWNGFRLAARLEI